jgi:hypothetical protein
MMLMIPGRAQGFAGEVSGLLGHRFDSSLQVVEFLPFAPFLMPLVVFIIPLDGFQGVDEQGILAPTQILRSDSTASPDRSVEVGSAVAIDKRHCTTPRCVPRFQSVGCAFRFRNANRPRWSSRSCSSSSKSASV